MSRVVDAEPITNFVMRHQNCLLSNHVSLCYFISCLLVCCRIFFINGTKAQFCCTLWLEFWLKLVELSVEVEVKKLVVIDCCKIVFLLTSHN